MDLHKDMRDESGADEDVFDEDDFTCDVSDSAFPLFVCRQCGNIIRVFFHRKGDKHYCRYCSEICVKTRYALSDDESWLLYQNDKMSKEFRAKLLGEYVGKDILDSNKYHRQRNEE